MWFSILESNIECVGLFQIKNRWAEGILFSKPHMEYFVFLHLESPDKTKLHPWKFYKIVLDPLKNSKAKNQVLRKFHTIFSWSTFEIPFYFSLTPGNYTCSFFDTPGNSISLLPLFFFFFFFSFLDLPIEHSSPQVICIKSLRCQWHTGELFYYQLPRFHQLIWEWLKKIF